jgi:dynein heavy chain 2
MPPFGKRMARLSPADWTANVERSLNRFNHDCRQLDLVIVPDALQTMCIVDRVLSAPGGSALLAGRAGYGRRSAVGVIANAHGMTVVSPRVTRDYGLKQFKNDLKAVRLRLRSF